MSVAKQYLRSRPICKVKFTLPETLAKSARNVCLAGDFNNWDAAGCKLRKQKDGRFIATLELEPGREYQYRYVLDGERWESDIEADKLVPNNVCSAHNSVVVV